MFGTRHFCHLTPVARAAVKVTKICPNAWRFKVGGGIDTETLALRYVAQLSVWGHLYRETPRKAPWSKRGLDLHFEGWEGAAQAEKEGVAGGHTTAWRAFGKLGFGSGEELSIPLEGNPTYLETQGSWMVLVVFSGFGPSRWVADEILSCQDRAQRSNSAPHLFPFSNSIPEIWKQPLSPSESNLFSLSHYQQSWAWWCC